MKYQRKALLKKIVLLVVMASFGFITAFSTECLAKKPESITVVLLGDLTGPYVAIAGPAAPGLEDAVKYVNEELGGIDGVKLKYVVKDNAGKVALGLQQYAEVKEMEPRPLFIHVPITPLAEALREKVVRDKIIGFFPSSIADLYPQGNAFGYYALYPEQAAVGVKWLKDNFKEKRNPRVAIITWDTAFGRAIITSGFYDYCKKIGVDIVATELFGVRDVDITTQMVRIRSKKPDWLLTNNTGSGPVAIMKAVKELGMPVKLMNCVAGEWGTVRLNPELFEGCMSVLHSVSYDNVEHPGIKKILEYMKKSNRTVKERTNFYLVSWQYVLMVHKAIEEAVAKVGWDKLNSDAIKNELIHLTNWEPLNGIVRITYTDMIRSSPWVTVFKIQGGKLINANGPGVFVKAPDLRPAKYR